MIWITKNIKWIMIVSGALTSTMIYAAIAPQAALTSTFGETLDGQLAEIVVRSWGALIALIGAMLIYGAYNPSSRPLILIVSGISKFIFVVLVLIYGRQYLDHQVGIAIVIDTLMVIVFIGYLSPKLIANK